MLPRLANACQTLPYNLLGRRRIAWYQTGLITLDAPARQQRAQGGDERQRLIQHQMVPSFGYSDDRNIDTAELAHVITGIVCKKEVSNGVQKGPPIGVEEGPPFQII